jgi:CRISPR-associated protein Cmr6
LSRGIKEWKSDKTKKGEDFHAHVAKAALLAASDIYEAAYHRWCAAVLASPAVAAWAGKLDGRLFIGLGGASVIEAAITLSRTYGLPLIPGSAQKGLAQAYAKAAGLANGAREILFGREGRTPDAFDSGYVIFHDAWWIPGSARTPLAQEIVTVHHSDYYEKAGAKQATDFDSPVPNVQVAARGSFLFTVDCADTGWAGLARDLLVKALQEWGIGGKTAAGYGRIGADAAENRRIEKIIAGIRRGTQTPDELMRTDVLALTEKELAEKLGRDRNKTKATYGERWDAFLDQVQAIHGELLRTWEANGEKNKKRAFKTVFQRQEEA